MNLNLVGLEIWLIPVSYMIMIAFILRYYRKNLFAYILLAAVVSSSVPEIAKTLIPLVDDQSYFRLLVQIWITSVNIEVVFFYLLSLNLYGTYVSRAQTQWKLFWYVTLPILIINTVIIFVSDLYFTYPYFSTYLSCTCEPYLFHLQPLSIINLLWQLPIQLIAGINIVRIYINLRKNNPNNNNKALLALAIAGGVGAVAGVWLSLKHFTQLQLSTDIINELLDSGQMVTVVFSIAFIFLEIARHRGIALFLKRIILFFIYHLAIYMITIVLMNLAVTDLQEASGANYFIIRSIPFFTLCFILFSNGIWEIIYNFFEGNRLAKVVVNVTDLAGLVKSDIMTKNESVVSFGTLRFIQAKAKEENMSIETAIDKTIREMLAEWEEDIAGQGRTKTRLEYEIVRLVYLEKAKESQILWELGFEANSNVPNKRQPLLSVESSSDYKATSVISYKRLRKNAFVQLARRFEDMENRYTDVISFSN